MAKGMRTVRIVVGGGVALVLVVGVAVFWPKVAERPTTAPAPQSAANAQPAAEPAPAVAARPTPAPAVVIPKPDAAPAAETAATPVAAPLPAPAASEAAPAPKAAPVARLDTLRVTPAGALTLAGSVAPGAKVELVLDGQVIDAVTANERGDFASITSAEPAAAPRMLRLRITGSDGVARMSEESLTVAPSPVALAEAAAAQGTPTETVAAEVAAARVLAEKPLVTDATGAARVLAGASDRLLLDTIAFAPDGTLSISGRGAPKGALLRAYVDNAEVGLVQAGTTGAFTMRLPSAKPGPHTLRVDALDAAGQVLARAEQGFTGVAPPALASEAAPGAMAVLPVADPSGAAPRAITVANGSTLWRIARETYGDPYLYVQIFEANRDQIRDPDLIYPGQVFALPN